MLEVEQGWLPGARVCQHVVAAFAQHVEKEHAPLQGIDVITPCVTPSPGDVSRGWPRGPNRPPRSGACFWRGRSPGPCGGNPPVLGFREIGRSSFWESVCPYL